MQKGKLRSSIRYEKSIKKIENLISDLKNEYENLDVQLTKLKGTPEFKDVSNVYVIALLFRNKYVTEMQNLIDKLDFNLELSKNRIELLSNKMKVITNSGDYFQTEFDAKISEFNREINKRARRIHKDLTLTNGVSPKLLMEAETIGEMGDYNLSKPTDELVKQLQKTSQKIEEIAFDLNKMLNAKVRQIRRNRIPEPSIIPEEVIPVFINDIPLSEEQDIESLFADLQNLHHSLTQDLIDLIHTPEFKAVPNRKIWPRIVGVKHKAEMSELIRKLKENHDLNKKRIEAFSRKKEIIANADQYLITKLNEEVSKINEEIIKLTKEMHTELTLTNGVSTKPYLDRPESYRTSENYKLSGATDNLVKRLQTKSQEVEKKANILNERLGAEVNQINKSKNIELSIMPNEVVPINVDSSDSSQGSREPFKGVADIDTTNLRDISSGFVSDKEYSQGDYQVATGIISLEKRPLVYVVK